MANTPFVGCHARIRIAATTEYVDLLSDWSLTITQPKTPYVGAGCSRKYVDGVKEISGSMTIHLGDSTSSGDLDDILADLAEGSDYAMEFSHDADYNSVHAGTITIESYQFTANREDNSLQNCSISFLGQDAANWSHPTSSS